MNATFAGAATGTKPYQRIQIASAQNGDKPVVSRPPAFAKAGRGTWQLPAHSVTVLTFAQ